MAPWFLLIMQLDYFDDMVEGAANLAILIGLVVIVLGVMPAIFLRERYQLLSASELTAKTTTTPKASSDAIRESIVAFFKGFITTLKVSPFLKLCAATFLVFNGFMLIAAFQSYVIIYYVFGGDTVTGAEYAGWSGTVSAIATFCVIVIITWLATRIGKRRAFFVATGISVFGYGMKWFCYNPDYPLLLLLPAPFIAFGLGGLFTLMGSMIADVCDLDELETHERREGMFGSIFWWVVKLGMALALAAGGFLLNATGFDVALEGMQTERTLFLMRLMDVLVPMVTSLLAIAVIATFPLTEEKAHQVRLELENRRGKIATS